MRKSLIIAALLMVCQVNFGYAQSMIIGPDSVCERQPVQLRSGVPDAATHFWGFCSGYLLNNPVGTNLMNNGYELNVPTGIEIVKEGKNYYGFVTNTGQNEFLRYEFGESLDNTPTVTNFGNLDNVFLNTPSSIYVLFDTTEGNWHVFISGGTNVSTSRLARIDFGKTLSNDPNIVNFGNINNLMDRPTSLFVSKEEGKWYGFFFNRNTNELMRMDMDTNVSITPSISSLGVIAGAGTNGPSDMFPILDNGNWYFFVTNENGSTISRIDMGNSLTNTTPTGTDLGNFGGEINAPSGISMIRDCDSFYAFVTCRGTHDLIRIDMTDVTGPYGTTNFNNIGGIESPRSIATMIRDRDNIYTYIVNASTVDALSKIKFQQCSNASIQSSLTNNPPVYQYDTAGLYNVYYAINEGQPDMRVECKQIRVLPIPSFVMSNDTLLCQGDTAALRIIAGNAKSFTWTPAREISSTSDDEVKVWPSFSTDYRIRMPFSTTCIVDTVIKIEVRKVSVDAGPNRTINDGGYTILGSPRNVPNQGWTYEWKPNRYLSDPFALNPTATPPFDFTYYLEVRDTSRITNNGETFGCVAVDTVIVYVDCNDLNLPNAFVPESSGARAKFGLTNQKVVKLNYLNIYDRWGQMVFTTTDPTQKWDGKINGEDAPMGVYVWEADAFCIEGKRIHKSGNVTLIR